MTTTNPCSVIPAAGAVAVAGEPVVSDRMVKFLADELIPVMAGLWPKSANQLSANLRGSAMAYGLMLKGLTANEIREVVYGLATSEPGRDFAPTPQELRSLCAPKTTPSKEPAFIASMSSLEMRICTKCLSGQIEKTQQAVDDELNAMIESVYAKGGEVVGSRGFAPLKSIIRG